MNDMRYWASLILLCVAFACSQGQEKTAFSHSKDGYYSLVDSFLLYYKEFGQADSTLIVNFRGMGNGRDIRSVEWFRFFDEDKKILLFANAQRVWRHKTRGDVFVYNVVSRRLRLLGKRLPAGSIQAPQLSPGAHVIAYVSANNVYIEEIADTSDKVIQVTNDGSEHIFNGVFDWAYEEEFQMRNGLRWSADGKYLAFWQMNATNAPFFPLINHTDSVYPSIKNLVYPKVGYPITHAKLFYYDLIQRKKYSIYVPHQPSQDYFITQLEAYPHKPKFIFQILNRLQQKTKIYSFHIPTRVTELLYTESTDTWLDMDNMDDHRDTFTRWYWADKRGTFLLLSEKGKFRRLLKVVNVKDVFPVTPDEFDVIRVCHVDQQESEVYFIASPHNATQRYLYKINYAKPGSLPVRVTPDYLSGWNTYLFSPTGRFAYHTYSSHLVKPISHWIQTHSHKSLSVEVEQLRMRVDSLRRVSPHKNVEFIQLYSPDGLVYDAWVRRPAEVVPGIKYPVLFYVYGEPGSQTTQDRYDRQSISKMYKKTLAQAEDFYYVALDNRGSPSPKGKAWRKAVYKKLGVVNVDDQAKMARLLMQRYSSMDTSRVGVWGWSGGGSVSLHLLFRYPQLYKTAISISPLTNLLTYDNIYEERYMGEGKSPAGKANYLRSSPITYAHQLKGNLLLIHGTADDNVHFQNAEMLINELIRHNKLFHFMQYPNRSHSISEGQGTREHLSTIFSSFADRFLFTPQP